MTVQTLVVLAYLGMVVILISGTLAKGWKDKYRISFNGCIYMVILELYIIFFGGELYYTEYHIALGLFWVWLGCMNIRDRIRFKKEDAQLAKLIEDSKKRVTDLFDDRRN